MSRARLVTLGFVLACCTSAAPEFFRTERSLLRPGVELDDEEREVRRVLAQRHLTVMNDLRGPGFVALSAATLDERASAVRVITPRGVVVAEDAAIDDLFAPSTVALLDDFGPTLGDYTLVAFARLPARTELGCVQVVRLLPDGSAAHAILDVSAFGSRACVASVRAAGSGHLQVTVAFPELTAIRTPWIASEIAFARTPLGRPEPLQPVARVVPDGPWLESERVRLERQLTGEAAFSERHAWGVARAALALASGRSRDEQLAAYRTTVGQVPPGSYEHEVTRGTEAHIERGWLDEGSVPAPDPTSVVNESPSQAEPTTVPEPEPAHPEEGAPEVIPDDAEIIAPSQAEPP